MAAKKAETTTGKKGEKKTAPATKKPRTAKTSRTAPAGDKGLFDRAPVVMIVIDEDATILHANQRFLELSGYTSEEVGGKRRWTEFVSSADATRLGIYLAGHLKDDGRVPAQLSVAFTCRDGSTRAMSVLTALVPGTRHAILSLVDITARKKFEQMLRVNEERYRSLVNTISTGIFRITGDQPQKFVWANPAFLSLFGFASLAELLKHGDCNFYGDEKDREELVAELRTTGYAEKQLIRLKKADGSLIHASLTVEVRRTPSGEIRWIDGTVEDLTHVMIAQARLREIAESASPCAIMTTDPEGVITLFGAGAERMLGYRAVDVIGKATPLIFLTESEIATRSRKIAEETGQPAIGFDIFSRQARLRGSDEREWTCVRRDGTAITVTLTVSTMQDAAGALSGYLLIAQEITDRKRVEEAFRISSLQMSGVIYNLPDATFAIDREGKVIAWNRAIEELTGIKAMEILGKGNFEYALPFYRERRPMLIDLVAADDRKIESWNYSDIRRTRNSVSAETDGMAPHGHSLIVRGVAAPIYDESGEIAGAIETIVDISELKRKESALEDTVSRYRAILDNTGAATAIIEEDSTITFINPEFGKILGYTREEIEGKRKWTEFISPEDLGMMQSFHELRRTDPQKVPSKYEFRFIRWDGEVRNGLVAITLIPETRQSVASLLDITDKIRAEDACQRANRKLNFFNATTRHEILNQLTVLKGNLDLALMQEPGPAEKPVLQKELAATEAIEALILFTRDYQDIGIQPPEWQDLAGVIRKAAAGVRTGPVRVEIAIGGVAIMADRLLEKVFFHLVSNAIQYGEKLTRIRLSCDESFEELLIVCEDDGIGIPAEAKEKIFNRLFYRKTGLDLYLSREILSLTGITIRETGTFGTGSRFELRVPKGAYRFTAPEKP